MQSGADVTPDRSLQRSTTTAERIAFAALFAVIGFAWFSLAPASPFLHASEPPYLATIAAALTALVLLGLRVAPTRRTRVEALLLALFLAGMPLIYLACAALAHDTAGIAVELVGLVIYGALALWGYRRSALILAIGIGAHGLAWDAWHHGRSAYVPDWYSLGCLLVDVVFALLAVAIARSGARHSAGGPLSSTTLPSGSRT